MRVDRPRDNASFAIGSTFRARYRLFSKEKYRQSVRTQSSKVERKKKIKEDDE